MKCECLAEALVAAQMIWPYFFGDVEMSDGGGMMGPGDRHLSSRVARATSITGPNAAIYGQKQKQNKTHTRPEETVACSGCERERRQDK